ELTKNPDAMISSLRKIEGRGELPRATSSVMELCVDNPRQGFTDLFATHPSVEKRVQALVRFTGGHDPGPLALPAPEPAADATLADKTTDASTTEAGATKPDTKPRNRWPFPNPFQGPWGP